MPRCAAGHAPESGVGCHDLVDQWVAVGAADHQISARVRQRVTDLAGAVVRVQRHDGRAQAVESQEVKEVTRVVAHSQRHAVACAPAA
jgi:ribosomal protein L12E/L44/L45/RPP1/RPP2